MALEFEDEKERYVRVTEIASVFGLAAGPFLGGILIRFTSYSNTFFIFASIQLICGILSAIVLPKRINDMGRSKSGT